MNAPEFPGLPFLTRDMIEFGNNASLGLRLATQSDAAVSLAIRGLTRQGLISFNQIPTSNSVLSVNTFPIPDFPIFISVIDLDGVLEQGQTFCRLSLTVNGDVVQELASGWVYTQKNLSWPYNSQQDLIPNVGRIMSEQSTDPSASENAVLTVPAGEIWHILQMSTKFDTDANAADRRVTCSFGIHDDQPLIAFSPNTQQANEDFRYNFAAWGHLNETEGSDNINIAIPENLYMLPEENITISAINIQAGDDFDEIDARIIRYFTPA